MNNWVRVVGVYLKALFHGDKKYLTPKILLFRFIEEVIELGQAEGVTIEEFNFIRDQVFNRPVGKRDDEIGGVLVSFFGYCHSAKVDPSYLFINEFERIQQPDIKLKILNRNTSGEKLGPNTILQTKS